MIVRCSWCQKVQGEKPPLDNGRETSTICRDCYRQEFPGLWVREVRTRLGLTQPQMAATIGVYWQTVSHWEQGVRVPGKPILQLLDRLLAESESEKKEEKNEKNIQ